MKIWVDILTYNSGTDTETRLGSGPITSASNWQQSARLDKAGAFSFQMPAADPQAALLSSKRTARCWGMVNGVVTELGAGIIDSIEVQVGSPTMLKVSGDDLLRELTYRTVRPAAGTDSKLEISTWSTSGVLPDYISWLDYSASTQTEQTPPFTLTIDIDDYLYIGHTSPFNKVTFTLGAQKNNNVSGPLWYQYFGLGTAAGEAGWYGLSGVSDGTIVGGAPFAQSGDLAFTVPADWVETSNNSQMLFWIRIRNYNGAGYVALDPVDFSDIDVYPKTGATDALATIMSYAPAVWSLDVVNGYASTTSAVYMQLSGETVLEALVKLAERTGEHFRLSPGREVCWLRTDNPSSGIRAINTSNPMSAIDNDAVAFVTSLRRSIQSYDMINGLYPYGGGQGTGRLTIADSTDTHAGYTINKTTNKVSNDAAVAGYGAMDRTMDWGDIAPAADSEAERVMASNALLVKAVRFIGDHKDVQHAYSLSVVKCETAILPGQTVQVIYREEVDGYLAVDIDTTLYVLESQTQVSQDGIRTVGLTVSSVKRWAKSDAEAILDIAKEARDARRRPQSIKAEDIRVGATGLSDFAVLGTVGSTGRMGVRHLPPHSNLSHTGIPAALKDGITGWYFETTGDTAAEKWTWKDTVGAIQMSVGYRINAVSGDAGVVSSATALVLSTGGFSSLPAPVASGWLYVDGTSYLSSSLFLNATANTKMTLGIHINQGANDDDLFAGASSDVAHGMTDYEDTAVYYSIAKYAATTGGAKIRGLAEATIALGFQAFSTTDDTAKTTAAAAPFMVASYKKSGTGSAAVGADGNLAVIRNASTTRFIFDGEGSAHADVEWVAFDDYDDLALISDFERAMLAQRDPTKAGFVDFLRYNQEALEAAKIVHFDRQNPGHAMVNTTRLSMLLCGAVRQLGSRIKMLEERESWPVLP